MPYAFTYLKCYQVIVIILKSKDGDDNDTFLSFTIVALYICSIDVHYALKIHKILLSLVSSMRGGFFRLNNICLLKQCNEKNFIMVNFFFKSILFN